MSIVKGRNKIIMIFQIKMMSKAINKANVEMTILGRQSLAARLVQDHLSAWRKNVIAGDLKLIQALLYLLDSQCPVEPSGALWGSWTQRPFSVPRFS